MHAPHNAGLAFTVAQTLAAIGGSLSAWTSRAIGASSSGLGALLGMAPAGAGGSADGSAEKGSSGSYSMAS